MTSNANSPGARARLHWLVAIGLDTSNLLEKGLTEPAFSEEEANALASTENGPIIDVWDGISADAAKLIRRTGLNEGALRESALDTFELAARSARKLGHFDLAASLAEKKGLKHSAFYQSTLMREMTCSELSFQTTGLTAGVIFCRCPISGETLASRHALIVPSASQSYLAYYFAASEPFFLVAGGFAGTKILLYLPMKDIIVRLQNQHHQWGDPWIFVRCLKSFAFRYPITTRAYLNNSTTPALIVGTINSIGHWMWNDLSGLARVDQEGSLKNLDAAIVGPYDFFEATSMVHSRSLNVRKTKSTDELYLTPLKDQLLAVRPTSATVTAEGASLILREAEMRASVKQRRKADEAARKSLLLWVNIRAHSKVWINQVDELTSLSHRLAADFDEVGIYLDGMRDCKEAVERLASLVNKNAVIYDGTDVHIYDTLYWASKIDCYIATIGTGLIIVSWLAGKVGVAHAEHAHLGQMAFWPEVRRDVFVPPIPDRSDIEETEPGKAYSNYTIRPGVITGLLYEVMRTNGMLSPSSAKRRLVVDRPPARNP